MIVSDVRIGDCRLILGDCAAVMPGLDRFGAVVTDPPYGIGRANGMGGGGKSYLKNPVNNEVRRKYAGAWDNERPAPHVFAAMLGMADLAVIWGGQYFADLLPARGKWLWWDKCQTMPSYGDGELAWTNLPGEAPKKFVYSNNGLHAKEKDKVHPTQKPVALMLWCFGFLPKGITALDPFMGSGSTLVAAAKLGLSATGIERDETHFANACARVEEAYRQADLFVKAPPAPAPGAGGFSVMMVAPVVHLEAVSRAEANALLVEWGHKMGPFCRPSYAIDAHHVLFEHGRPVAVTCASETVREVVGQTGIRRADCVELARLCAARPRLCRVMLRLWCEAVFPSVAAVHHRSLAVSYQDTALHTGQTYRFDGWENVGPGGGGGKDSRTGRPGRKMNIWAYPPGEAARLKAGLL